VRRRERIENAIDEQLATFYHRLGYLDPMLRSVGVGIGEYSRGKKNLVVDLGDLDYTKELSNYPLLYPFPNQKSVPTTYGLGGGEIPEPVPKAESCGYPVTLWGTVKGWAPGESTASLKCGEEPVESWVFSRESEALKEHPRPSVVCILPKKPLLPNTTYTVTVKCKKYGIEKTPEWSKTWSFTTGKGEGESK